MEGKQTNLFDHIAIQKATEAGIKKGYDNAHTEWRTMALSCLYKICNTMPEFTVNDVRDLVEKYLIKTHDNRAMGGVIKTGQKMGWFEPTGRSIPSLVGHKVHIQIWKSLIYKKSA